MTTLAGLILVVVLFAAAERMVPVRPKPLFRRGFLTDLLYLPIHFSIRVAVNGIAAFFLVEAATRLVPAANVALLTTRPLWIQVIVLLVVLDFFFYVTHRLKHRWRWWWRLHETHHSSLDVDWLSTFRAHPLDRVVTRAIYLFPLTVLGPSSEALVIWTFVDVSLGMLTHANLNIRLGPLIYLFNGPELHRWHHSKDPRFQQCNFGNNFAIFDWVFRTAHLPEATPIEFGLEDPVYPEGNILRQFLYAFRPLVKPAGPSQVSN